MIDFLRKKNNAFSYTDIDRFSDGMALQCQSI